MVKSKQTGTKTVFRRGISIQPTTTTTNNNTITSNANTITTNPNNNTTPTKITSKNTVPTAGKPPATNHATDVNNNNNNAIWNTAPTKPNNNAIPTIKTSNKPNITTSTSVNNQVPHNSTFTNFTYTVLPPPNRNSHSNSSNTNTNNNTTSNTTKITTNNNKHTNANNNNNNNSFQKSHQPHVQPPFLPKDAAPPSARSSAPPSARSSAPPSAPSTMGMFEQNLSDYNSDDYTDDSATSLTIDGDFWPKAGTLHAYLDKYVTDGFWEEQLIAESRPLKARDMPLQHLVWCPKHQKGLIEKSVTVCSWCMRYTFCNFECKLEGEKRHLPECPSYSKKTIAPTYWVPLICLEFRFA